MQMSNLDTSDKSKDQEREPSVLAISTPTTNAWFPLLPITAPSHKKLGTFPEKEEKVNLVLIITIEKYCCCLIYFDEFLSNNSVLDKAQCYTLGYMVNISVV